MKKITFLLAFILTACVFTAKAQYANMPKPVITKNISAYTATKLSFSPDSRYLAAEYKDILEKELTTIIEVATGQEVTASKAGYPWAETKSSAYEIVDDYKTSKNPELCIKEKATGKKVYGIDICIRKEEILEIGDRKYATTLSSNNNFVAVIYDVSLIKPLYKAIEKGYGSQELYMDALHLEQSKNQKEIENLKNEMEATRKQLVDSKNKLIQIGDRITEIKIFRIGDLPAYKSFVAPTVILPQEIKYRRDDRIDECRDYRVIYNENKKKDGIASREKIIVMPKYDHISMIIITNDIIEMTYNQKYVSVKNGNLEGLVELATGREVVPPKYDGIGNPTEDGKYVSVMKGEYSEQLCGVVNLTTSKEILAIKYKEINIVGNNASVKENGKSKLIDLVTGKEITSDETDDIFTIYPLENNRVIILGNNWIGKIKDNNTNTVLASYEAPDIMVGSDSRTEFVNDRSRVYTYGSKNNLGGFIDKKGDLVIPLIYEELWKFSEGLAAVKKDGKWGFIDVNNKVVIPFIYDDASEKGFVNGKALVKKDGNWINIDKTGK